jgi:hypothetical protein
MVISSLYLFFWLPLIIFYPHQPMHRVVQKLSITATDSSANTSAVFLGQVRRPDSHITDQDHGLVLLLDGDGHIVFSQPEVAGFVGWSICFIYQCPFEREI